MGEKSIIEELWQTKKFKIASLSISIILVATSLLHLWTGWFGISDTLMHRELALTLYLLSVFGVNAIKSKGLVSRFVSTFSFTVSLLVGIYVLKTYTSETVPMKIGVLTSWDIFIGAILVILVLEGVRRSYGLALVILALFFTVYAMYGEIFPGVFAHKNIDFATIINILLLNDDGIYGFIMGIMATYLFLFVLFGSLFGSSGGGDLFIKMATSFTNRFAAGASLTPVFASSLFGMISGSPTSNVMVTGTLTIPLMKKAGYSPEFAAAMEASASSGGQIMPPIMGIAAFVMAEFVGVDYAKLMGMAVMPAVLYFLGLSCSAYFTTKFLGIVSKPSKEKGLLLLLLEKGHLLIPLVAMVTFIILGASLMRAAFIGCFLTFVVSFLRKNTRMSLLKIIGTLEMGARQAASIGMVMAWVGIITGLISSSGFGSKLGSTLLSMAGGNLILSLVIIMIVALILGMGMTTIAVYIVVAITLAPHIINLGINPIAAHLFGFYFGCLSFVTPPVCLATYAAAALANANVVKAGIRGFLVSISGFLIPYVIVFEPALILQGTTWLRSVGIFVITAIGIVALTSGICGFLIRKNYVLERLALICGGVCLILPNMVVSFIGGIVFAVIFMWQFFTRDNSIT